MEEINNNNIHIELEENKKEMKQYVPLDLYENDILPKNVSISTMTITGYLGSNFNMENIEKYMILNKEDIIAIKSAKNINKLPEYTLKSKSANKNSKKNFYNQLTTIVKINEEKYMNIKLFKNSSIQITGCKSLDDCNIGLNKIINKLKEVYSYIDENGDFIDIKFVDNPDDINVSKMKIVMINSNFTINYSINREILYNILRNEHMNCRYNPSSHACVNIKYNSTNDHKVSIFVFQTGKIIITGAKNLLQIKQAYDYIYVYLQINKNKIMKKDISKLLSNDDYLEIKNTIINEKNINNNDLEELDENLE